MAELLLKIDADEIAEKVLDDFEYEGKSIREWATAIVSGEYIPKEKIEGAIGEIKSHIVDGYFGFYADSASQAYGESVEIIKKHTKVGDSE